uniref:Uncharacterized protein n=1 Tax=Ascaris lumbricoides TaxID=6252 RepID=A0A0M3I910_ASCLU
MQHKIFFCESQPVVCAAAACGCFSMVGLLFGKSCVPVLGFIEPPPRTFTSSTPLSFTVSLSIRQPAVVTVSLLTDDLRLQRALSISPQQSLRFEHSTIYKFERLYVKEVGEERAKEVTSQVLPEEECNTGEEFQHGFQDYHTEYEKEKASLRIMVEACTPSASATIVSEPVLADTEIIIVSKATAQHRDRYCARAPHQDDLKGAVFFAVKVGPLERFR